MNALKVLVLDDEQARHDFFRKKLPSAEFTHTFTASEANKALNDNKFDAVYLDHDLGQVSKETGMDTVDHIVSMPLDKQPNVIVVHSMNAPARERMVNKLTDAGLIALARPFTSLC